VIYRYRGCERDWRMTILTDVGCLNVGGILAGRIGPVVTAEAPVGDVVMIEEGRGPAIGGVAVVAVIAAGDVIHALAFSHGAVVAAAASTEYLQMVDSGDWCENYNVVAVLADI